MALCKNFFELCNPSFNLLESDNEDELIDEILYNKKKKKILLALLFR